MTQEVRRARAALAAARQGLLAGDREAVAANVAKVAEAAAAAVAARAGAEAAVTAAQGAVATAEAAATQSDTAIRTAQEAAERATGSFETAFNAALAAPDLGIAAAVLTLTTARNALDAALQAVRDRFASGLTARNTLGGKLAELVSAQAGDTIQAASAAATDRLNREADRLLA